MTTVVILALLSSLAYGAADFFGGSAARGAHVLRVVAVAAPASLAIELLLWPVIGATFSAGALGWGAASGVASAAAFALLYRALALGPMSVLSPVTALVAATLPVAVGLLGGEHLGASGTAGVVLALIAVVLVSGSGDRAERPTRAAIGIAFGAGAAVALQLVCFDRAPDDSGAAPLIAGRIVSWAVVLAAALALRSRVGAARPDLSATVGAGVLNALAGAAFLLAVRDGALSVVAVIAGLYPAGTILLARLLLGERLGRVQLMGLALAAGAVGLLAAG